MRPLLLLIPLLSMPPAAAVDLRIEGYAPRTLDTLMLKSEYARICRQVGLVAVNNTAPLHLIFYRHADGRKTGIRLPEWGGGGAIGGDSIVIPVDRQSAFYRSDMERIILHEMVHIALARAYGRLHIPRWFHEGMAMTLSGELDFEEQLFLSRAIVTRSLVPLDSMERLNQFSRRRAQVAYSQCHFAVGFLLDTYGYDLIPELLRESRKTRRFETACLRVFGLTVQELELLLQKEMASRYRLLFLFADYSSLWFGILALATVAFVATKIRNRRKRERMELEEREAEGVTTPAE
ncbi:MAG: hypothetical protein JXA18_14085 [Chitinispirillaceae bacterium]|nr:hypothetical protein [Chitinispirillaceae bacterium]